MKTGKTNRLLALLLLLAVLAGCSRKAQAPTTVIFTEEGEKEVPLVTVLADTLWDSTNLNTVLRGTPGYGKEFLMDVETLTREEPERSNRLTRIRTEIMAGKGPDVFLINQQETAMGMTLDGYLDALFPFPQQAMDNRIFLPLDDYMENARLTDFDRQLPAVMELGRNEEGQQLLPMGYNMTIGVFSEAEFREEDLATRDAMLASGDLLLENFALRFGYNTLDCFGREADYEAEKLTFTEEELLEEARHWRSWLGNLQSGKYREQVAQEKITVTRFNDCQVFETEDQTAVPAKNRNGGVTAYIETFGAVNRNAPYPELSFRVLDRMMSTDVQCDQALYGGSGGTITDMYLNAPGEPVLQWLPMTEEGYARYTELRDQITDVCFPTGLDMAAYEEIFAPLIDRKLQDDGELERAAHKAYTTMKMMLAES